MYRVDGGYLDCRAKMILGMTSVTTSINDYNYHGQSLLSKSSSCDSRDENSDVTVSLLDQCQDQHNTPA